MSDFHEYGGNMDDFEAFDVDCQLELLEDATQNELEAFAAFSQAKRTMFKRKKGKGKGKGKNKGNNSGKDMTEVPFKAHGTISFNEQQKAERLRRISQIKARTQRSTCGQYGHWSGDAA